MNDCCARLHRLVNKCERFRFPFDKKRIFRNGIYVLFECGEGAHCGDRIVRIGTHTGDNQLPARLQQHFLMENKDRSIFRKNVGRALLSQAADPLLPMWELDRTSCKERVAHKHKINPDWQLEWEQRVSSYIRQSFTFVILPVAERGERLQLESRLISTVSTCRDCQPSQNWLGASSPKPRIRQSGLWQVNELYKECLSPDELVVIEKLFGG